MCICICFFDSTKEVNSEEKVDLDEILEEFGLGPYQVIICILMGFVLMYSNISPLSYAITASDLKYRYFCILVVFIVYKIRMYIR